MYIVTILIQGGNSGINVMPLSMDRHEEPIVGISLMQKTNAVIETEDNVELRHTNSASASITNFYLDFYGFSSRSHNSSTKNNTIRASGITSSSDNNNTSSTNSSSDDPRRSNYQRIELDYVPFAMDNILTHHMSATIKDRESSLFVISGSNHSINTLHFNKANLQMEDISEEDIFGFHSNKLLRNSPVTAIDIQYDNISAEYLVAMGHQDGSIYASKTPGGNMYEGVQSNRTDDVSFLEIDGPITCVSWMQPRNQKIIEDIVTARHPRIKALGLQEGIDPTSSTSRENTSPTRLLTGSAVGYAGMYEGLLDKAVSSSTMLLPKSHLYDSVLCCESSDFTGDGCLDIAIGTYGQQVLMYKVIPSDGSDSSYIDDEPHSGVRGTSSGMTTDSGKSCEMHLASSAECVWERRFNEPVYAVHHGDFSMTGVDDLVVCTMTGVHRLQSEYKPDDLKLSMNVLIEIEELQKQLKTHQ